MIQDHWRVAKRRIAVPGHGDSTYYAVIVNQENDEIARINVGYTEDYDKEALKYAELIADLPRLCRLLRILVSIHKPSNGIYDSHMAAKDLLKKHGIEVEQ